jgi:hypothetical protein
MALTLCLVLRNKENFFVVQIFNKEQGEGATHNSMMGIMLYKFPLVFGMQKI